MSDKKNTSTIQLAFRDADVPEAIEKIDKGTGRVTYGKENLYPQWLYSLFYESPIHQGIINQKVTFVFGNGVEATGTWASMNDEIQRNGVSKYNLDEVIEQAVMDFEVLEYYYLLFKFDVKNNRWIVECLSGELMRPNESMTAFEYSENWKSKSQSFETTGYKIYPSIFNRQPEDKECVMYVKTQPKQVLVGKNLTSSIFPQQSYSGCITSIMADIEMNWYHYTETINSWTSDVHINFCNGIPEEGEQKKMANTIRDQFSDRKRKAAPLITWSMDKDDATTITRFSPSGSDTKYILTQDHLVTSIMIGHSVQNPALFGLEIAGKLGQSVDLQSAFSRFSETYCAKRRKNISESITYGLGKLNSWTDGGTIAFKEYTPTFERQVTADNKTATALNGMSPLVANNVLQNLTVNEIRALANLEPIEGGDILNKNAGAEEAQQFGSTEEAKCIALFSTCGTDASKLKFKHSQEFKGVGDAEFITEYLSTNFAIQLNENQRTILKMIKDGESYNSIVKAVGEGAHYVSKQLILLEREGYISRNDSPKMELTSEGERVGESVENVSVLYTYEVRPDVPEAKSGSRPFCERLIQLNRAYTRAEIDSVSSAIGRDVWLYRGGWYHNPNTDKNTPSCRHYWKQNIIIT